MAKAIKQVAENPAPVEKQRTYYAYTKYKQKSDRGTIAAKRVKDNLYYGISICTPGDVWDRTQGRKLAAERMDGRFGKIKLNTPFIQNLINEKGEQNAILFLVKNLSHSVESHIVKFKRKLEKYNKPLKEAVKSSSKVVAKKAAKKA